MLLSLQVILARIYPGLLVSSPSVCRVNRRCLVQPLLIVETLLVRLWMSSTSCSVNSDGGEWQAYCMAHPDYALWVVWSSVFPAVFPLCEVTRVSGSTWGGKTLMARIFLTREHLMLKAKQHVKKDRGHRVWNRIDCDLYWRSWQYCQLEFGANIYNFNSD